MAKVMMRYEATYTKWLEVEVPDEIFNDVVKTKREWEEYAEKARLTDGNWWDSVEHDNYDHACDRLEEYIDFDAPYKELPDADYIYINSLETEDGDELIGW